MSESFTVKLDRFMRQGIVLAEEGAALEAKLEAMEQAIDACGLRRILDAWFASNRDPMPMRKPCPMDCDFNHTHS